MDESKPQNMLRRLNSALLQRAGALGCPVVCLANVADPQDGKGCNGYLCGLDAVGDSVVVKECDQKDPQLDNFKVRWTAISWLLKKK